MNISNDLTFTTFNDFELSRVSGNTINNDSTSFDDLPQYNYNEFDNGFVNHLDSASAQVNQLCRYYSIDEFNQSPISKGLSMFHLNSRSLNKNFNDIADFLSTLHDNFSVIGFSETWFTNNISPLINIDNYTLVDKHREGKRGGGVCMFVHNKISYKMRDDISVFDNIMESVFIEISISNRSILIGVLYRPPNGSISDFNNSINNIFNQVTKEKKDCYLMGDFNIDILHQNSVEFTNVMYANNFYPLITKPTRVSPTSATLIDNILTNAAYFHSSCGVLVTDLTDHFPVFCKSYMSPPKEEDTSKFRNFSNNNIINFISQVEAINWHPVVSDTNVNSSFDKFNSILSSVYNDCFPLIQASNKTKKKRHPWITSGILKSIKQKNKLFKAYLKNPSDVSKTSYCKYRNKLNHVLRIAKKNYFSKKFYDVQNDAKGTWSIINSLLNKNNKSKYSILSSFKTGENNSPDPKQVADEFNRYFIEVGPSLSRQIKSNRQPSSYLTNDTFNSHSLFLFPTSKEEILKIASHCLKPNKAAGYDEFKPSVIKKIIHLIANPIMHICNISMSSGIFPDKMKVAKVIPVFKKGNPKLYSNYRPISVLSCFSKILERLIYNRVITFLDKHNILYDGQYGFRHGVSTELALVHAVDKLYNALENKLTSIGIFLDLS